MICTTEIEKIFECFEPEYIQNFKCDGNFCNAQCCRGFQVDIDRQTHMKYRSIKNQPLRKKILDSLYWNETSQTYRMNLNDYSCPMICEDSLCLIQKNFGEDFLSDICAEFPRRVYVIGETVTRSMSLNCPLAAKIALITAEPMKFQNVLLRTKRARCFFYRSLSDMPAREFLIPLQKIGIEILQNRNFSVNKRIFILGIMMSMMDFPGKNLNLETVNKFAEQFRTPQFFERMENNLKLLEFRPTLYLKTMFALTEEIFNKAINYYSSEQRNFIQYVPQAFDMVNKTSQPLEKLEELYKKNFAAYDEFIRKPYPHLMENYFVHNFFAGLYPCRIPGNFVLNYFLFLTTFKLFEFGLICMAGVLQEKLTLWDILEFIGRFSHRVDHGTAFQDATLGFLQRVLEYPTELFCSLIDFEN